MLLRAINAMCTVEVNMMFPRTANSQEESSSIGSRSRRISLSTRFRELKAKNGENSALLGRVYCEGFIYTGVLKSDSACLESQEPIQEIPKYLIPTVKADK